MIQKPKVFISYRRAPSAMLAALLFERLQDKDIDVYVDTRKVDTPGPFPKRLLEAINDCDIFVCLVAESTFDSEWVRKEIEQAHILGKPLIPVFQESYKPLTDMPDEHVKALLQNDAIHVFDVKNIYIDNAIDDLARIIKSSVDTKDTKATKDKTAKTKGMSDTVKVAIIAGIFGLIAALIAVVPPLLELFTRPTPTQVVSSNPTETQTNTPQPATETATSTSVPPTNTETPQPATETPTATPSPSDTPQPSLAPTNTPAPPTNTAIPTIAPTTPAISSDSITLTIFRDEDSLTLYMPKTDQPLSLAGLAFQVEITGQNRQFPLIGYSSFGGNSILGNVSILNSAACFRLVRSGSRSPAPLECQSGALPLTQNVADADVFWYDSTSNQHRTVLVLRDGGTITVCAAGQTTCDVGLPLVTDTQMVNVAASMTATPGYPCEGTIGASQSSIRNIVHSDPVSTASIIAGVAPGARVLILEARQEGTKTRWYRIGYEPNAPIGWIRYDFLDLSPSCPQ